ncbi:hypothetical protein [Streptomyces sannanensis]|uniref:hypothetical protein n=1 Tax=Streptomyces sannanensis TaxID=285536 RepID=UPI0031E5D548
MDFGSLPASVAPPDHGDVEGTFDGFDCPRLDRCGRTYEEDSVDRTVEREADFRRAGRCLSQIHVGRLLGVQRFEEVGAGVVGADDVRGAAILGFTGLPELGEEAMPQPFVDSRGTSSRQDW